MSNLKNFLNFVVIFVLTFITFFWTFYIFHYSFNLKIVLLVAVIRMLCSFFIFKDYSMSWQKATPKSFLIKSFVYIVAFMIYMPIFYNTLPVSFFVSELFIYLFLINFLMYSYYLYMNRTNKNKKNKTLVIYGAGRAGMKLGEEYRNSEYKLLYYIDDDKHLQNRSIDGVKIISPQNAIKKFNKKEIDLLIIAMPSASQEQIKHAYDMLEPYAEKIKILPSINEILKSELYSKQLKDISIEDLLARKPKDLDKNAIRNFVKDKIILITGAGGSIGSEICRQCEKFGAKKLILVENSEYNLYSINEELSIDRKCYMVDVTRKQELKKVFCKEKPDIVIHAAAYKHVPLCEENPRSAVINNIIGTKNSIDLSIEYKVKNFILISTDKAVRPTNIMGATKRVCELYAQNIYSKNTKIAAVRFGNVLGSSGSVVPKFKKLIEEGKPLPVTHPEITRYFMLIPEACQLVLQAGSLAKNGEIFILDMGKPVKIIELAKKMLKMYGKDENNIIITGLRPGEKLYEELLINDAEAKTIYDSIFVASPTYFDINKLNNLIYKLLKKYEKKEILKILKELVKEFNHKELN
jgi:FlaA1/EpsC-like NDP-sugar epimerase